MATDRQTDYLRDLGVDRRACTDDLPKEEASAWIEELKEYSARAGSAVGRPLTVPLLRAVGAREDALVLPPGRSVRVGVEARDGARNETRGPSGTASALPPGDGAWWKVERACSLDLGFGEVVSIRVSGSEHVRGALDAMSADRVGALVRDALAHEVAVALQLARRSHEEGSTLDKPV